MSERRACKVIGYCRMTVRYETRQPDDPELRGTATMNGPAFVQGLFESVEHKAGMSGPAHPLADDTARI